eukprot:2695077-Amphidinium_carterae.1
MSAKTSRNFKRHIRIGPLLEKGSLDKNNMPRSGDVMVYKKDSTLGQTKASRRIAILLLLTS